MSTNLNLFERSMVPYLPAGDLDVENQTAAQGRAGQNRLMLKTV